jgi:hypothetical protein
MSIKVTRILYICLLLSHRNFDAGRAVAKFIFQSLDMQPLAKKARQAEPGSDSGVERGGEYFEIYWWKG